MGLAERSKHVVRRVGRRGIYMCISSESYVVPDAEDDSRRYLELMNEIGEKVIGVTDYSGVRSLQPGVRGVWSKVMADRGRDYSVIHALLPAGTIGKVVGMAMSAWGLMVGVRIACYAEREAWVAGADRDGVQVPRHAA